MLKLTNTLSGKKEDFKPIKAGHVSMYVCGITPYDRSHVGHGRCYVAFDLLYRVLRFLGNKITYVRNFTDIDDKLLNRAQQQLSDKMRYKELANTFIASFHEEMNALGCLAPTYEPRVTEHMDAIITFIQGLIDKGYAYAANGDVYFQISKFAAYGKLSKHKVEDLRAGQRVDVREEKKDPLDFALWKGEQEGEFWKSPWGYGRPGWHIECSSLAEHYLGERIDIHGGGMDLVFPHHENEIAQSEGLHAQEFARYWVHNGLVNIEKEKMSKSLGNVFFLEDIFKDFDPMVLRFYFLNHHYRAPLDFSFDDLQAVQKSYQRLCLAMAQHKHNDCQPMQQDVAPIDRMISFLYDDMNTTGMLGVVFEHLREIQQDERLLCAVKLLLVDVLGLDLQPLPEQQVEITPQIQKLLDERASARAAKDWARADEIREQLHKMGVEVRDTKTD